MTTPKPVASPFHDRLTPGTVFDGAKMMEHPSPSFESIRLLPLKDLTIPEEPRKGIEAPCLLCTPDETWIWRNEHWHVNSFKGTGMPFQGALTPNQHCLLDDAPAETLASLGQALQELSLAVKKIPGVARLHYGRFNDGGAHWHQQLVARPTGMMQARGAMSFLWATTLPEISDEMWLEHSRIVAHSLAAWEGESLLA